MYSDLQWWHQQININYQDLYNVMKIIGKYFFLCYVFMCDWIVAVQNHYDDSSAVCAEDWVALSPLNFLDFYDEMASQLI